MSEKWESSFHRKEEEEEEEEIVEVEEQANEEEPEVVEEEEETVDTSADEQPKQWQSSFHRTEEKQGIEPVIVSPIEKIEPIVLTEDDKQAFKQVIESIADEEEEEETVDTSADEQPKQWQSTFHRKEEIVEEKIEEISTIEKIEPIIVTEDDKQAFKQTLESLVVDGQKEDHPFYKHEEIQPIEPYSAVEPEVEVTPSPEPVIEPVFEQVVEPKPEEVSWKSSINREEERPIEEVKTVEEEKSAPISEVEQKTEEEKKKASWKSSIYRKEQEPSDSSSQKRTKTPKAKKPPRKRKKEKSAEKEAAPTRALTDDDEQKDSARILLHRFVSWCLATIAIVTIMLGYTITERWASNLSAVTEVHLIFEWTFMVLLLYHLIYTLIFIRSNTIKLVKDWKREWVLLIQKSTKWLILLFATLVILSGFNQYDWGTAVFASWLPFRWHVFFDTFLVVFVILHVMAGSKLFFNRKKIQNWWINIPIILIGLALIIGAIYIEVARLVI